MLVDVDFDVDFEKIDFWRRVTTLFYQIDGLARPDKRISRAELVQHFRGNTAAADRFVVLLFLSAPITEQCVKVSNRC